MYGVSIGHLILKEKKLAGCLGKVDLFLVATKRRKSISKSPMGGQPQVPITNFPVRVHQLFFKSSQFYKVKIAPIILFTDDTSENMSMNYNGYESWSMRMAALPFEERNDRGDTYVIAATHVEEGVRGVTRR